MSPKDAYDSALRYREDPTWQFKDLLSSTIANAHKAILEGAEVARKKGYPVLEGAIKELQQNLAELSPNPDDIIKYVGKGCREISH